MATVTYIKERRQHLGAMRTVGAAFYEGTDGGTSESGEASGVGDQTGWEAEREVLLSFQNQTVQAVPAASGWADMVCPADNTDSLVSALVGMVWSMERSQPSEPVIDSTTIHHHADSKMLRREKRKKIALGHKADDHEDEQIWQQRL